MSPNQGIIRNQSTQQNLSTLLWVILLNNQLTCDAVVNTYFMFICFVIFYFVLYCINFLYYVVFFCVEFFWFSLFCFWRDVQGQNKYVSESNIKEKVERLIEIWFGSKLRN